MAKREDGAIKSSLPEAAATGANVGGGGISKGPGLGLLGLGEGLGTGEWDGGFVSAKKKNGFGSVSGWLL